MEFVCTDSAATVRGLNVLSIVEAFALPETAKKMLERHGIKTAELRADKQIPVQRYLDALQEISHQVGTAKLRAVGAKTVQTALFPPQYPTVESVLLGLDDIYHLNHTGRVGHYLANALPSGGVRIFCETPYPRAFERGLVEGIARNVHLNKGRPYEVAYRDGEPGSNRTCILTVLPI